MKTLAILRHGKSSWSDPDLADFDRPLNKRGERASRSIGRELRRRDLVFDLVIASPAKRVVETIAHLSRGYEQALQPQWDERVYEADATRLLQVLREVDAGHDLVLLVGHNPGLQELASILVNAFSPARSALLDHFPTAALAVLRLPAGDWTNAAPGGADLLHFLIPREIEF